MYTIIISKEIRNKINDLKFAYKQFSILNYFKFTFPKLPANIKIEILNAVLSYWGAKIDYNENQIFLNFKNKECIQDLITDLIGENVITDIEDSEVKSEFQNTK